MPVAEIFLNDPEMMRGLLRVTGKHRLEHKGNAISPPSSAFNTLSSSQLHQSPSDTATSSTSPLSPSTKVPSAFSSTATHFTPIVLSDKDKDKPSEEKEKKVARTLKELKRNLIMNRQTLNLVKDVEQDAAQGERSRSQTPGSKVRSKSTSSQPDLQQTSAISPYVLPAGSLLGQGPWSSCNSLVFHNSNMLCTMGTCRPLSCSTKHTCIKHQHSTNQVWLQQVK